MKIVELTNEIALQVSRIYAQSWKAAYRNIVPQKYLDELSLDRWEPFLTNSLYTGFVIQEGNEFVATSSVSTARDDVWDGWGEIISLYVLPSYFHQGYGKKLLDHGRNHLYALGCQGVTLWVLEENRQARAFYERNGFAFQGERKALEVGGKELYTLRYVTARA